MQPPFVYVSAPLSAKRKVQTNAKSRKACDECAEEQLCFGIIPGIGSVGIVGIYADAPRHALIVSRIRRHKSYTVRCRSRSGSPSAGTRYSDKYTVYIIPTTTSFGKKKRRKFRRFQLFLSRDLKQSAITRPKNTAAQMPPAEAVSPPVNAPRSPFSSTASRTPLLRRFPNPVRGTVAPAPAHWAKGS